MFVITREDENDLLVVTTQGDLSQATFMAMIAQAREHLEDQGGKRLLVDHTRATVHHLRHDQVVAVADMCCALNEVLRAGWLAVVLHGEADYGLGRMWLSYTGSRLAYESQLFREVATARNWLLSVG